MTTPEFLDLYPVPHPSPPVRRVGFPLDHPYLEQCWGPLIGPSSVALLRHCVWHWRDAVPARVDVADLAAELGLGRGRGRNSPIQHTLERVVQFRFAGAGSVDSELQVYTQVPPVDPRRIHRLPGWAADRHEHHLGEHLDALARATPDDGPPAHVRMAAQLDRLATNPTAKPMSLGR